MESSTDTNPIRALLTQDAYAAQRCSMNECRFNPRDKGHFEHYILRANHPEKPLGFWLCYSLLAPRNDASKNKAEISALVFDGDCNQVVAAREAFLLSTCQFDSRRLNVRIGSATLQAGQLQGNVKTGSSHIRWQLNYVPGDEPVKRSAEANVCVANPNSLFEGLISVNGETLHVSGWIGSEQHQWGKKLQDEVISAQVAGFDNAPDAFLDVATVFHRVGPFRSPGLTRLVCRVDGMTLEMNRFLPAALALSRYDFFDWRFETRNRYATVRGQIDAPREYFTGLTVMNPIGGSRVTLNSGIARCRLEVKVRGRPQRILATESRALFEILTNRHGHGVPIVL